MFDSMTIQQNTQGIYSSTVFIVFHTLFIFFPYIRPQFISYLGYYFIVFPPDFASIFMFMYIFHNIKAQA